MWFLECEAIYGNRREWLRPGTEHLFGRTHKKPELAGHHIQAIEHPSVSRQHLVVVIEDVRPGASAHLHGKTKLTVTDNSKLGTTIDGQRITKETATLEKNEHVLKLGNYEHVLRIRWQSFVFSFTSLSRASKQAEDPLATYRAVLEPLGIKCVSEYVTQFTSHVVAKKRNTSAVLQALVNGRQIVTDSYVNAIQVAAKKPSPMEPSQLEEDFDANWPKELQYLPPPGNEPNPRPEHSTEFLPLESRSDMFARYTFVFHESSQYESLMAVVAGGGGKSLLREVVPGKEDANDMIEYVRDVAGKKGDRSFRLSQQPPRKGGVVIVKASDRLNLQSFYDQLDRALGQSSMMQNEFLEAILLVDASILKQSLNVDPEEENERENESAIFSREEAAPPPNAPLAESSAPRKEEMPAPRKEKMPTPRNERIPLQESAAEPSQTQPSANKRRGIRRPTTQPQPRFKGFDDFDPDILPEYRSPSPPQAEEAEPSQVQSPDPMELEYQSQVPVTYKSQTTQHTQQSSRKRPLPGSIPEEHEETAQDVMNGLLKGAAAMKKRKLEQENNSKAHTNDDDRGEESAVPTFKRPRKHKEKEMDVRSEMLKRNEEAEARVREDEESLREALEGMDVHDIRNLAQIEEMDIVRRDPPSRAAAPDGTEEARWDDRWNGRKNFKKFRRRGEASIGEQLTQRRRVIVSLEEVKKKGYGMGEEYWLESVEDTRRKEKERRRETQSQRSSTTQNREQKQKSTQSQRTSISAIDIEQGNGSRDINIDDDSASESSRFRRRIQASLLEDAEQERAEELHPWEIAGTARDKDLADKARSRLATQTQTQSGATQQQQQRKRPAPLGGEQGTAAKKAKPAVPRARVGRVASPEEESEEEDALRFRRRKR
ncbi:hypothetical protein MBLNU459_g0170t1 [Dothideomycetes sp. NU459]